MRGTIASSDQCSQSRSTRRVSRPASRLVGRDHSPLVHVERLTPGADMFLEDHLRAPFVDDDGGKHNLIGTS